MCTFVHLEIISRLSIAALFIPIKPSPLRFAYSTNDTIGMHRVKREYSLNNPLVEEFFSTVSSLIKLITERI